MRKEERQAMKISSSAWRLRALLGVALLMALLPLRLAADPDPAGRMLGLGPDSRLWLEGTSTLHDYESETRAVVITWVCDPSAPAAADLGTLIQSSIVRRVDVRVPVLSLRSKKSGLDKNLWRTLGAEKHPDIRCQLTRYTVTSAPGDSLQIRAEGTLEVAGRSRAIVLDARGWKGPHGLWVSGSAPLLMSDYGIKPPTMMMGALRVADRVTVRYRLLLTPKDGAASPSAEVHEKGAVR
jgi:hypothetical protein